MSRACFAFFASFLRRGLEFCFAFGFLGDPLRIGRILHQISCALHLTERCVDRVLELVLEAGAHLAQLRVQTRHATDRSRQLLRAEHDQGDQQDENDLAALQIEHGSQSTAVAE